MSGSNGFVDIHSNVHISTNVNVSGGGGVTLCCGSGLSSGVSLHSVSDDYVKGYLRNPTLPERVRLIEKSPVHIGPFSVIGANSVVLPGVSIGVASSVPALTKINFNIQDFSLGISRGKTVPLKMGSQSIKQLCLSVGSCAYCEDLISSAAY